MRSVAPHGASVSNESLESASRYLQVFLPGFPLQELLQHCELAVQVAPDGRSVHPPVQAGLALQFESAQSVKPSQSLSTPSVQTSADGVQPPAGSRNGATELQ